MKGREVVLGAGFGVLSALVLIAIVSGTGAPSHHIDLIPTTQNSPAGSGSSPQAVGTTAALTGPTAQSATPSSYSNNSPSPAGYSLIWTILPLILAAGLGAGFYGFYARRIDAE